jgi:hypothetical protein
VETPRGVATQEWLHEDTLALVEALEAVESMVAEATVTLERAQETIVHLRRALNVIHNPRGEIRPTVGVLNSWELSSVFFEA